MNRLNEIIEKTNFENGKLYLIEKHENEYGFFYQDQIVYFGKKSDDLSDDICSIDTQYLDLNAKVYISSVTENNSFDPGYYDLLSFKGELDNQYFDVFYNICLTFIDDNTISFGDFFRSLVEIFQKSKDGQYKNLVGLIGELLFIKSVFEVNSINITSNWHLCGINSKFDFSFPDFNIEIKTTTKSEQKFLLKYNQIFNNQNNYVCVVNLIETGEGESLNSLYEYFSNEGTFSKNVKFQIALTKEIIRVTDKKEKNRSFVIDVIELYNTNDMETIKYIPSCISNISFEYDFADTPKYRIEEVIKE